MADANLVKICRKCNKELAVDEFERRSGAKDGRRNLFEFLSANREN